MLWWVIGAFLCYGLQIDRNFSRLLFDITVKYVTASHSQEFCTISVLALNEPAWPKADNVLRALAIASCGATLVAAWRDGGAAKRTRL